MNFLLDDSSFTKIKHDINGNPRWVCHFLCFDFTYDNALVKARKLGGRKYHNKSYGGGIVFQAYSPSEIREAAERIFK